MVRRLLPGALLLTVLACGSVEPGDSTARRNRGNSKVLDLRIELENELPIKAQLRSPGLLEIPEVVVDVPAGRTLEWLRERALRPAIRSDLHNFVARAAAEAVRIRQKAMNSLEEQAAALNEKSRGLFEETVTLLEAYKDRDVRSLRLLASIYQQQNRQSDAKKVYEELLTRFPQDPNLAEWQSQLAYVSLGAGELEEARRLIRTWGVPEDASQAYVQAWTLFLSGDVEGAADAISSALSFWQNDASRPALEREALHMWSRAGLPAEEVLTIVRASKTPLADILTFYSDELRKSGHYKLAAEALSRIESPSRAKAVELNFRRAGLAFQTNEPATAAEAALRAHDALVACGLPCAAETRPVKRRLLDLAHFYHSTYSVTHDERYAAPAESLYKRYSAGASGKEKVVVARQLQDLRRRIVNKKSKRDSLHDQSTLWPLVSARRDLFRSCFSQVLTREKRLFGEVEMTLAISAEGSVEEIVSSPPAGPQGLAALAGCIAKGAITWTFPRRAMPGETRLVFILAFESLLGGG